MKKRYFFNKNSLLLYFSLIISFSFFLTGCNLRKNLQEKLNKDTTAKTNVGMQDGKYIIDTSLATEIGLEKNKNHPNIEITLPEGFTAIGDTDTTSNAYISLYHADTEAKTDDYVMTYLISKNIEEDREETLHTYSNMYSSFMASEIEILELENNIQCKYYTATYMLSGETLTDYIFEFPINDDISVLAKLGTTFYPLDVNEVEAGMILYKNIEI